MSNIKRSTTADKSKANNRPTLAEYILYLMRMVSYGKKSMHYEYGQARKYLSFLKENQVMPDGARDKISLAIRGHRENARTYRDQYKHSLTQVNEILTNRVSD